MDIVENDLCISVCCDVFESRGCFDEVEITQYGIKVNYLKPKPKMIIYENITSDYHLIKQIAHSIEEFEVSELHLHDIIEDIVSDFYTVG